jgi:hypothetical protein
MFDSGWVESRRPAVSVADLLDRCRCLRVASSKVEVLLQVNWDALPKQPIGQVKSPPSKDVEAWPLLMCHCGYAERRRPAVSVADLLCCYFHRCLALASLVVEALQDCRSCVSTQLTSSETSTLEHAAAGCFTRVAACTVAVWRAGCPPCGVFEV